MSKTFLGTIQKNNKIAFSGGNKIKEVLIIIGDALVKNFLTIILIIIVGIFFHIKALAYDPYENAEVVMIFLKKKYNKKHTINKILSQNKVFNKSAKIKLYNDSCSGENLCPDWKKNPHKTSLASLKKYDKDHKTSYIKNRYTTLTGKVGRAKYIMIKVYDK